MTNTTRVLIRLKHSLAVDEEIHTVMPDTLEEFEEALARIGVPQESEGINPVRGDLTA